MADFAEVAHETTTTNDETSDTCRCDCDGSEFGVESVMVGGNNNRLFDEGPAPFLFNDVIVGGISIRISQSDCIHGPCQMS